MVASGYEATILADSTCWHGKRVSTFELRYPHYIHKELMTHRVFSRSFMSMRAVPPGKAGGIIDQVIEDPVIPEFHGRATGMGTAGPLSGREAGLAQVQWLSARDAAVQAAKGMDLNNVAKSDINPLLEPWVWMRGVVTATEWNNFFALRLDEAARKEFRFLADLMHVEMNDSEPTRLKHWMWHLPGLTVSEFGEALEEGNWTYWANVSAGRLARISYDKVHLTEEVEKSLGRAGTLLASGHMSPFEHQAKPALLPFLRSGNFIGWKQYRKSFKHEDNFYKIQEAIHA